MALTRPRLSQIESNISVLSDPITVLNGGAEVANVDIGFLLNRANGLVSNVAYYWNDAANSFVMAFTTSSGSSDANLAPQQYANLTVGSITANSLSVAGGGLNGVSIGATTPSTGNFTTLFATNFSTGNARITGGYINSLANLSATQITVTNFSTSNAQVTSGTITGLTNLTATTTQATNFSSGNVRITGGYINSLANISATQATVTNFGTGNAQITGGSITGLSGGSGSTSGGTTQTLRVGSGGLAVTGDSYLANSLGIAQNLTVTGSTGITGALTYSTASGGSVQAKAIGNVTPGTGAFTTVTTSGTLISSGNIVAGSGTSSSNTTTGALVVTGGAGISGNLNIGGSAVIAGNLTVQGETTTLNVTTLEVEDLNITVAKGAGSAAAANGAGITVDGAGATFNYTDSGDKWVSNKSVDVTGNFLATGNIRANSGVASTSTSTGAIVVTGGVGVSGRIYAGSATISGISFPTSDGTIGQVLVTNGAGQLSFAEQTGGGGGGTGGFVNSTITVFPTGDWGDGETYIGSAGAVSDAFGVSLGTVYDCMEPSGSLTTTDLDPLT